MFARACIGALTVRMDNNGERLVVKRFGQKPVEFKHAARLVVVLLNLHLRRPLARVIDMLSYTRIHRRDENVAHTFFEFHSRRSFAVLLVIDTVPVRAAVIGYLHHFFRPL